MSIIYSSIITNNLRWGKHKGFAGKIKGAHWMNSGLLPTRPDRVTGSRERFHIEMGVPVDFETYNESDWRRLRQTVEMEVALEDMNSWDSICELRGFKNLLSPSTALVSTSGPSNTASAAEVVAEKSASQIMAEKIEVLKITIEEQMNKFSTMVVTLKIIRTKVEANKEADMMASFAKSVSSLIVKADKVSSLLSKLLSKEANSSELPTLIELLEDTDSRYENTLEWADKFEVSPVKAKKARR